jgi:hypothetical protein
MIGVPVASGLNRSCIQLPARPFIQFGTAAKNLKETQGMGF